MAAKRPGCRVGTFTTTSWHLRQQVNAVAASAVPAFVDDAVDLADLIESPVAEQGDDRLAPIVMPLAPRRLPVVDAVLTRRRLAN
ncbi:MULTISPECIES: hypothetical protein [unclassified Bradyrhizobium]|uniref:hypothetical protein n=1 Tax=unclassified Bradyrhizobium TaxID=2631580 RepID=UPI00188A7580|nr:MULTISPECIES: hypothetical protein [unclassified Bradyrhizobium]MDN4982388.1 hypothetical protein [Bradyrhizobium sp. WYCCWR 13022]QOZ53389.1 hypothetical protein XH90_19955 [Bradyrhizobium sp. CCBAU 53338]